MENILEESNRNGINKLLKNNVIDKKTETKGKENLYTVR